MGFPLGLEPCCAGASPAPASRQWPCGVAGEEPSAAIGYRTPPRRQHQGGAVVSGGGPDGDARVLVCPPTPRKKRRPAAAAPVAGPHRTMTEFYTGGDLEAFFAAHNV